MPFVLLTVLLLALPLLALLLFGRRASRALTRMREWAERHAWIVNEIVIAFSARVADRAGPDTRWDRPHPARALVTGATQGRPDRADHLADTYGGTGRKMSGNNAFTFGLRVTPCSLWSPR